MERCWSRRHRTSVAQARATTTASSWTEDGKRLEAGVLATWDICSGNWSAVHDEGGLLAKTWEMRVQSTQSILRPFSQRRGPICVVCLSLNQAIHLFLLLRASRAGVAVDEAINDLPGTQYARGSDQKQGRRQVKRPVYRKTDRFLLVRAAPEWSEPGNRRCSSSNRRHSCEGRVNSSVGSGSANRRCLQESRGFRPRRSACSKRWWRTIGSGEQSGSVASCSNWISG